MSSKKRLAEKQQEAPYSFLFAAIILLFTIVPLLPKEHPLLVSFFVLLVMLATIRALDLRHGVLKVCVGLGVATFVLTGMTQVAPMIRFVFLISLLTLLAYIAFFTIVIFILLQKIFYTSDASWDSIRGGISVYFLLGIAWAFLYELVLIFDPGAIAFVAEDRSTSDTIYFSFTTLTTLGYGDNLPMSKLAKNLTILESTLGQIFLTVLVARLVGMHLAQQSKES